MMTREQVYQLIRHTREYVKQDRDIQSTKIDSLLVEDWLPLLRDNLNEIMGTAWSSLSGDVPSDEAMVKLASMTVFCVTCLEHNGYVRRGTKFKVPGPASLDTIFEVIDGERDYQDQLPETRTDGRQHTVGGFICMMDYYLQEALKGWVTNPGDQEALSSLRKVTAIGVQCLERHGFVNTFENN